MARFGTNKVTTTVVVTFAGKEISNSLFPLSGITQCKLSLDVPSDGREGRAVSTLTSGSQKSVPPSLIIA